MKKTLYFFLFIFACCLSKVVAQEQPLYNQYMMNYYLINPAVAGSDGFTSFDLTARQQWLGFKGSPSIYTLSGQARLLKRGASVKSSTGRSSIRGSRSGRVGVGGYIYNDVNGAIARTGIQASYAYHIFIGATQVSMGLTGAGYQIRIDKDKLILDQPDDPKLQELKNVFVPDATLGFYVMNNNFNAGFSVSQLFQEYLNYLDGYKLFRNYYLHGGYRYYITKEYYIAPNLLFKVAEDKKEEEGDKRTASMETDISVKAYFHNLYYIGAAYRSYEVSFSPKSVILLGGVKVQNFYFAYAFDYPLGSEIRNYSYGSHEIMISMKLGANVRRDRFKEYY